MTTSPCPFPRCIRKDYPLIRPSPPPGKPFHPVHQPQQHRHLDQRPNRRRESLIRLRPVRRHGHRNRQLKVVARGGEALRDGEAVPEPHAARHGQRGQEDDGKVHDQRGGHAHDRHDLPHHLPALRGEQHEDGEEQADQGPRGREAEEAGVVALRAEEGQEYQAGEDRRAERDAQEDAY